jgi:DNA invertase Pin-like site-specific DNA recombinase
MESLDTSTAMGRFVMDIIQRIAQLESEQIGERVYTGMEQKARINGGVLGFNIPYGYDYKDGQLQINKNESLIINNIFSWYLNGKSMGKIIKMLNNDKVPTKRGGFWAKKIISTILKNPVYCGYLHWKNYRNKSNHTPIITEQDFDRAQHLIEERGGNPAKTFSD